MIRQKNILTFIALLVLTAMTFNDTQFIFIDSEEIIEAREVEREEEVKEGSESEKSDFKKLLSGGSDFISSLWAGGNLHIGFDLFFHKNLTTSFDRKSSVPLFIMHCALKVHLS